MLLYRLCYLTNSLVSADAWPSLGQDHIQNDKSQDPKGLTQRSLMVVGKHAVGVVEMQAALVEAEVSRDGLEEQCEGSAAKSIQ